MFQKFHGKSVQSKTGLYHQYIVAKCEQINHNFFSFFFLPGQDTPEVNLHFRLPSQFQTHNTDTYALKQLGLSPDSSQFTPKSIASFHMACVLSLGGNLASCFVVFIFLLDFAAIHSGNGNYFYLFTKFFKSLSFCI